MMASRCRVAMAMVVFLGALGSAVTASAANQYEVIYDGTVTSESYTDSDYTESRMYLASTTGRGMELPTFTAYFSTDKQFEVRFAAPEGQHFVVTPPFEHAETVTLDLYPTSNITSLPASGSFDGLTFEGLEGPAPTVTSTQSYGGSNSEFTLRVTAALSGDISFTSMVATWTLPGSYNTNHVNDSWSTSTAFRFYARDNDKIMSDPDQWVTLESIGGEVPEPSTLLLLCLSLLACGAWAVRRKRAQPERN
ncbi:PEP-CTERM sorting domain-containing protein [Planctomycetota bacterium]